MKFLKWCTRNSLVIATVKLMLFSAVLHLSVLAFYFLKTNDLVPLNFYSIVGLNLFFPSFVSSSYSSVLSFVTIVALYLFFLYHSAHENRRTR
jgi:predicted membrane protein